MRRRRARRGPWELVSLLAGLLACQGNQLDHTEAVLRAEVDQVDFGPVVIGDSETVAVKLHNPRRARVLVYNVGSDGPFQASIAAAPMVIEGGGAKEAQVGFQPSALGAFSGQFWVESDSERPVKHVPLKGLGVKSLVRVPNRRLDFGDVSWGGQRALDLVLENRGSADAIATLLPTSGPDANAFFAKPPGANMAVEVKAGTQVSVPVVFRPNRVGGASAMLALIPCDQCPAVGVHLTGNGVASTLVVDPLQLDFGTVPVGTTATQPVTLKNLGTADIQIDGAFVVVGGGPGFHGALGATLLAAGAQATVDVSFSPRAAGAQTGTFRVKSGDPSTPIVNVALTANGYQPCLSVMPRALDYGTVAVGMAAKKTITLANACTGGPITVTKAAVDSGPFVGALPVTQLNPAQAVDVVVAYQPTAAKADTGNFHIESSAPDAPVVDVPLKGNGVVLPACQFKVSPQRVDFGAVAVGSRVTLGFTIQNVSNSNCFLSDLDLTPATPDVFKLPGGRANYTTFNPWDKLNIRVQFAPKAMVAYAGQVSFFMNGSPNAQLIPLAGLGADGCLRFDPPELKFGVLHVGCAAATRATQVTNNCSSTKTLASIVIGPSNSTELTVGPTPALPYALLPGTSIMLSATYQPKDHGFDAAPLEIDAGEAAPRVVPMSGEGVISPTQTDLFAQQDRPKVDVLWVIDNSGSLSEEQAGIATNTASFMRFAIAQNIDYHIGVTTTGIDPVTGGWTTCPGGADGGEAGRLFPVDNSSPRIISSGTPDPLGAFAVDVKVGICHWLEQGLEASFRALSSPLVDHADDPLTPQANDGNLGFLRDEAKLAVIYVSDEDDQSPRSVQDYLAFLRTVKGNVPEMLSLNAVVGPLDLSTCPTASDSGRRYIQAAQATNGVVESICTPDWAGSLARLARSAFGPQDRFTLSGTPQSAGQIQVEVNGIPVPPIDPAGDPSWTYDPATNSVVFSPNAVPPPGSTVKVTYVLACP